MWQDNDNQPILLSPKGENTLQKKRLNAAYPVSHA